MRQSRGLRSSPTRQQLSLLKGEKMDDLDDLMEASEQLDRDICDFNNLEEIIANSEEENDQLKKMLQYVEKRLDECASQASFRDWRSARDIAEHTLRKVREVLRGNLKHGET